MNYKEIYQDKISIKFYNDSFSFNLFNEILDNAESRYFLLIDSNHDFSDNYLKNCMDVIVTNSLIASSRKVIMKNTPNKIRNILNDKIIKNNDTSLFGVVYNTIATKNLFNKFNVIDDILLFDIIYRAYYGLNDIINIENVVYNLSEEIVNEKIVESTMDNNALLSIDFSEKLQIQLLQYCIKLLRNIWKNGLNNISINYLFKLLEKIDSEVFNNDIFIYDYMECLVLKFIKTNERIDTVYKVKKSEQINLIISDLSEDYIKLFTYKFLDKEVYVYKKYSKLEVDNIFYKNSLNENSIILIYDDSNAKNNGEYFYRFLKEKHSEYKNIYFALNKKSDDYLRLKEEGFNLIEVGSDKFNDIFYKSDVVISSQFHQLNYRGKNLSNSRFVFLQHGITISKMYEWLLPKYFDLMVISSEYEKNIYGKYFEKELLEAGMSRLEGLKQVDKNYIAYLPTWRKYLNNCGENLVSESKYIKTINDLCSNSVLIDYLEKTNSKFIIKLHPKFSKYRNLILENKYFEISNEDANQIIARSKLVITDYSSVVLDAAYINIPIAYYQFDKDEYLKKHTVDELFDFKNKGLGPVFKTEQELVDYIIKEDYENSIYLKRKENFFFNCDDVNEKILAEIRKI